MAPGSSAEAVPETGLGDEDGRRLLALARSSLGHGLREGCAAPVSLAEQPARLCAPGASFVTLLDAGALRGCIGSLEPTRALAVDVAENAFAAGFRDPRFPPVAAGELPALHVHVSVLGPPEPLPCRSEAELLARLRPGVDGLVLLDAGRRGTFLPSVWESLAEPRAFVRALRQKAGLPPDDWSPTTRAWRYSVQEFDEAE